MPSALGRHLLIGVRLALHLFELEKGLALANRACEVFSEYHDELGLVQSRSLRCIVLAEDGSWEELDHEMAVLHKMWLLWKMPATCLAYCMELLARAVGQKRWEQAIKIVQMCLAALDAIPEHREPRKTEKEESLRDIQRLLEDQI